LTTYELAKRLQASGLSTPEAPITVNAFAPGLMAGTGLGRDSEGFTRFMWYAAMPVMSRLIGFGGTAAQAGADLAYLATSPALADVTGKYFNGREIVESSTESYDQDKAADLWQTSAELCRLESHESPLIKGTSTEWSP
jgi:protochlorophyllide reductase